MGKEFIVEGAMCMCKFGASPGMITIKDQNVAYMNGKLVATSMTLGNVFQAPGFGVCKMNPMMPRACAPAVTQWSAFYDGMTINNSANPLTDKSKGSCATGVPNCIEFITTGQIAIPGLPQITSANVLQQVNLDPLGSEFGLAPYQEDYEIKI